MLLPRFDAEATLAGIEEHHSDIAYLVPTMMKRIWRLPLDVRERYDLSSLRLIWHLAEPCPPWLKEAWIEWLGPERIFELYAGTEAQTATVITGNPVSYTHLDVYKRQPCWCGSGKKFKLCHGAA